MLGLIATARSAKGSASWGRPSAFNPVRHPASTTGSSGASARNSPDGFNDFPCQLLLVIPIDRQRTQCRQHHRIGVSEFRIDFESSPGLDYRSLVARTRSPALMGDGADETFPRREVYRFPQGIFLLETLDLRSQLHGDSSGQFLLRSPGLCVWLVELLRPKNPALLRRNQLHGDAEAFPRPVASCLQAGNYAERSRPIWRRSCAPPR